ncbi:type II toxin-antitoxin system YafQ family toxin [Granulicella sp. dw_53]|uniref:type II toxin-antitoxin system YafQ family toxin n=1 Tax=Granulicella sp. dw_53 TaxID=2719792 RepID=UPI001BD23212
MNTPKQSNRSTCGNPFTCDRRSPPDRFRDHALSATWQGFRDCHIRPDLILIYRKSDPDMLELARLGSHSELFKK